MKSKNPLQNIYTLAVFHLLKSSGTERAIFSNKAIQLQRNQERLTDKLRISDICVWLDSSEPLLNTRHASHPCYELTSLCYKVASVQDLESS